MESVEYVEFLRFEGRAGECPLVACVGDLGEPRRLVAIGAGKFRLVTEKGTFDGDGLTTEPATTCAGLVSIIGKFLNPVRRVMYFNPIVTASLFKAGFGFPTSEDGRWPVTESDIPLLSADESWNVLAQNFCGDEWKCERTARQVAWIDMQGHILLPRDPFDMNAEYGWSEGKTIPELEAILCRLLTSTNGEGCESLLPMFMRARDENRLAIVKLMDVGSLKRLSIDNEHRQLIKTCVVKGIDGGCADDYSVLPTGTIDRCSEVESLYACVEGDDLHYIERRAFAAAPQLREVVLEGDYMSIGEEAFAQCKKLERADIGNNLDFATTGGGVFRGCERLREVYWGVGSIPADTFRGCKSLSSVKIHFPREAGRGPLKIGKDAFRGCESLERLSFDGDVEFEGRPFLECTKLREIRFGGQVTSHIHRVLGGCTALERVEVQSVRETIPSQMFVGCESVKTIVLPKGLRTLDVSDFRNCKSLWMLPVPNGVESVTGQAKASSSGFRCPAVDERPICSEDGRMLLGGLCLKEIVRVERGVESVGPGAFENDQHLQKVILTDVFSVGERAFCWCHNLKSVSFPRHMKEIGKSAFAYCTSLKSVSLPYDLGCIGSRAFFGCENLRKVTIKSHPYIAADAFDGCFALRELRVPVDFNLGDIRLPPGVTIVRQNTLRTCPA